MDSVVEAFKTGESNTLSYTGGSAHDELASLLSLTHGVRAALGSVNRWFHPGDNDPRGSPVELFSGTPTFEHSHYRPRIPTLYREVTLSDRLLSTLPVLQPDTARELVRAT